MCVCGGGYQKGFSPAVGTRKATRMLIFTFINTDGKDREGTVGF